MQNLVGSSKSNALSAKTFDCSTAESTDIQPESNDFEKLLRSEIIPNSRIVMQRDAYSIEYSFNISVLDESQKELYSSAEIATIANDDKLMNINNRTLKTLRKFFRIGVAEVFEIIIYEHSYSEDILIGFRACLGLISNGIQKLIGLSLTPMEI